MFLKLVVFTIFAATMVQSKSPPVPSNLRIIDGDFNGYVGSIRNAIDSASRALSNSRANINQQVDVTTRQLQATLRSDSANLLQELQVLIEKAKLSGVDINVCEANSEQRIRDLPVRFDKQILKCQEDIVNEEIALANEGTLEIERSNQELTALLDSYNRCSGILVIKCRNEITADAHQASGRISLALSNVVDRVTAFDSSLQPNLKNCGSSQINLAVSEGRKIINNVSACIDSHVRPHNVN